MTTVINVKKKFLNKRNILNFSEWDECKNTLYIGRNMSFYVNGANKSKWCNPFAAKKYGREKCLELYEKHILSTPELYNNLHELKNKELGCWCKPESCHGDILIKLLVSKSKTKK